MRTRRILRWGCHFKRSQETGYQNLELFNVFFLGLNHAKYETRRRSIRKGIVFIRDSLPISLPHTLCMRRIDILLHNLLPTTPEFKFFIFETKRSMTLFPCSLYYNKVQFGNFLLPKLLNTCRFSVGYQDIKN